MGIIESIGATLGVKIGGTIWNAVTQAYDDWQKGRSDRLAMTFRPDGGVDLLSENEGVLWTRGRVENQVEQPIILNGAFIADESFIDYIEAILDNEDKVVLIFAVDEETGEVSITEFGFDGYIMAFWPGTYSFYAFIIDPEVDDILAVGYPASRDQEDPNPIMLEGSGNLPLDFVLFEVEDEDEDELYDDDE